jgi:exopolysaccharide biosynthesis WecB/TagA/CpsF family protein
MKYFPPVSIQPSHRDILDLAVCDFGWEEAFAFVDEVASLPIGQTVISFLNANNANYMMTDPDYRAILERHVVLPDGHGIDIASKIFYGKPFPANLNGTDFVPAMLTYMRTPRRVAMVGARQDVLLRAAENWSRHTPWHTFIPVSDGYFELSQSDAVMAKVRDARPDILLIAMGTPRQEKWIDRYVGPGHARLVLGVGALFDFAAGEVPRAPESIRNMRLEWLYRMAVEPHRLWKRYMIGIPVFLRYVVERRLAGKRKTRFLAPGSIGPGHV